MSKGNEFAFPMANGDWNCGGLTKREWLAGILMAGLYANTVVYGPPATLAQDAVRGADALLAELEKS